jgi:NADPH2:quinone reductase
MKNEKISKNFLLFMLQVKIKPEISDRFSLEESAAAIAHLKDRKAKGKVIIDV